MRPTPRITSWLTIWIVLLACGPLAADTVFLRNGKVLRGVVTVKHERGYLIVYPDGTTRGATDAQVLKVEIKKVQWNRQDVIALVRKQNAASRKLREDLNRRRTDGQFCD